MELGTVHYRDVLDGCVHETRVELTNIRAYVLGVTL